VTSIDSDCPDDDATRSRHVVMTSSESGHDATVDASVAVSGYSVAATGTQPAITQCYLPSGRCDIPARTPAEAAARSCEPGRDAGLSGDDVVRRQCACAVHRQSQLPRPLLPQRAMSLASAIAENADHQAHSGRL